MRVLLINPKFRLPIDTRTTPHLGLAYLGAVSEQRGDEVRIYDGDVEEQPVEEFVQEFQPHIVGITANTPQVMAAWRTATASDSWFHTRKDNGASPINSVLKLPHSKPLTAPRSW